MSVVDIACLVRKKFPPLRNYSSLSLISGVFRKWIISTDGKTQVDIIRFNKEFFTSVEQADLRHLLVGEAEIEDVEILFDARRGNRFRQNYDSSLNKPAQGYLRRCFSVFRTDFIESFIVNNLFYLPALHWCIGLQDNAFLPAVSLKPMVLKTDVAFHLIRNRNDTAVLQKCVQMMNIEVGNTDRSG